VTGSKIEPQNKMNILNMHLKKANLNDFKDYLSKKDNSESQLMT
jgi:hypothetical protein